MAGMRANIELAAKKKGFLVFSEFKKNLSNVSDESTRTRKELVRLNQQTEAVRERFGSAVASARNFAVAIGAGMGLAELTRSAVMGADAFKQLTTRISRMGMSVDSIYALSQANGVATLETVRLTESLNRAASELGRTQTETLTMTSLLQQLGVIGGSSAEDMKNSMRQFGQAMSGGIVRAEEFNSIIENTPEIAARIGEGMGLSMGQLRAAMLDGKLTADAVFQSLIGQAGQIATEYAKVPLSIDSAMIMLGNAWQRLSAEVDKHINVTGLVSGNIAALAGVFDSLRAGLDDAVVQWYLLEGVAVAVATVMASKVVVSLGAAMAAQVKLMATEQAAAVQTTRTAWVRQMAAAATAKAETEKAAAAVRSAQLSKTLAVQEVQLATTTAKTATSLKSQQIAMDQLTAAKARQSAVNQVLIKSQQNANIAQAAYVQSAGMAQKAATAMGVANQRTGVLAGVASKAVKGLGLVVGALGGPIGIAIAAVIALIYYFDDLKAYAESSGIADRFATEFEHISSSWAGEMEELPEVAAKTSDQVIAELRAGLSDDSPWTQLSSFSQLAFNMATQAVYEWLDNSRKTITYLPQYYDGLIRTIPLYTQAAVERSLSWFEDMRAGSRVVFAAIVDGAAWGFGLVGDVVGQVIGFILDRFANLASIFTAAGGLASMMGLDGIGDSLKSIETGISGMADTTRGFGDGIRSEFTTMADGIRESAAESATAARTHDENAASALRSADAIWNTTNAAIAEAETMRSLSLEMNEAEAQFAALDAQSQSATGALEAGDNAAQGAAGAIGAVSEAADKATGSKQKLTEAQKTAAKAADELGKANQRIADQFVAAEQKQAVLNETLLNGAAAGRQLELRYDSMHNGVMLLSASRAAELQEIEAANTAIEEEAKRREEASKAIEAANQAVKDSAQSLEIARQAIGMNDEQLNALTLSYKNGYTKELAAAQAANEAKAKSLEELRSAQIAATAAVKDAEAALKLAEGSIGKTDQQVRTLELSLTKGYTPALAAAQAAAEAKAKATDELRSAQQAAQKALEDTAKSLSIAEKALHLTDQGVRELELSLTKGYTPAQAAAQAADESRIKKLEALRSAQESARKAVDESTQALEIASKAVGLNDEQLRALTLSYQSGYNPTMAAAQAANEAQAKSLEELRGKKQTAKKAMEELAEKQRLQNILLTEGAAAAEAARLKVDEYSDSQIANKIATEANMEFQQEFYDTLVSSIDNAESVKDFFDGLGDWMKDWLKQRIAEFAANKIMISLGVKQDGSGGGLLGNFQKMFGLGGKQPGATGAGGGFGQMFGSGGLGYQGLMNGGSGGLMAAAGPAMMAGGLGFLAGDLLGAANPAAMGALSGIGMAVAGPIGAVVGGIVGSLFGGKKEKTGAGFELGYTGTDGLEGQNYETYKKKKSFWRGTKRWTEYSELDSGVADQVGGYFEQLNNTIVEQAEVLGVEGAENILDSFEMATRKFEGENAEEQLKQWLSASTRKAYHDAFKDLAPELKHAIQGGVNVMAGSAEEIAARFQYVAVVAQTIKPALESLGLGISESFTGAIADSVLLTDAMGGVESTMSQLAFYAQNFVPVGEQVNNILQATTAQVYDWNESMGLGGSTLDVAQSALNSYTMSLDLNTTAGQLAMEQVQAFTTGIDSATGTVQINRAALDEYIASLDTSTAAGQQAHDSAMALAEAIGLTGGAAITSREQFYDYMQSLDLTTEAGREAAAAAFAQMEAVMALEAAHQQAKMTLDTVSDAARNLNLNFDATSPTASAAASALVELMGGLDAFTSATQNYYSQFYSQQEQQQLALANAASSVAVFNDSLGLTGQAAIDTASEFRNYVESLDLTTEEGRAAYAAAMDIADSMAAVTESGMSLNELIGSLPDNLVGAFELMSAGSVSTADIVSEAANDVSAASYVAGDSLDDLGGAITGVATAAASAASIAAQAAASASSAAAQAAQASGDAAAAASAAKSEYEAQQALAAAEQAAASAGIDGSHAGGLFSVPFDGYRAELHAGEMVLPAPAASALRDLGVPVNQQIDVSPNVIDARPVFSGHADSGKDQKIERLEAKLGAVVSELQQLRGEQKQHHGTAAQQRGHLVSDGKKLNKTVKDNARDSERLQRKQVING